MVEARESTRKRSEPALHPNHEDYIEGKVSIQYLTTTSCTNLFPCFKRWKILDAKVVVNTEWEKHEKIPARIFEKMNSKKDVVLETQEEENKVHFATLLDMSPQECRVGTKIAKRFKDESSLSVSV